MSGILEPSFLLELGAYAVAAAGIRLFKRTLKRQSSRPNKPAAEAPAQAEAHQVAGLGQVAPLQQSPSFRHRSPSKSTTSKHRPGASTTPSARSLEPDHGPEALQTSSNPSSLSPIQHSKSAARTLIAAGCDPDGYCTSADASVVQAAKHDEIQHQAVLHVQSDTVSACDPDRYCNIPSLSSEAMTAHIDNQHNHAEVPANEDSHAAKTERTAPRQPATLTDLPLLPPRTSVCHNDDAAPVALDMACDGKPCLHPDMALSSLQTASKLPTDRPAASGGDMVGVSTCDAPSETHQSSPADADAMDSNAGHMPAWSLVGKPVISTHNQTSTQPEVHKAHIVSDDLFSMCADTHRPELAQQQEEQQQEEGQQQTQSSRAVHELYESMAACCDASQQELQPGVLSGIPTSTQAALCDQARHATPASNTCAPPATADVDSPRDWDSIPCNPLSQLAHICSQVGTAALSPAQQSTAAHLAGTEPEVGAGLAAGDPSEVVTVAQAAAVGVNDVSAMAAEAEAETEAGEQPEASTVTAIAPAVCAAQGLVRLPAGMNDDMAPEVTTAVAAATTAAAKPPPTSTPRPAAATPAASGVLINSCEEWAGLQKCDGVLASRDVLLRVIEKRKAAALDTTEHGCAVKDQSCVPQLVQHTNTSRPVFKPVKKRSLFSSPPVCMSTPDAVQSEQQPHETNQLPAFSRALSTRHQVNTQPAQQPANWSHGTLGHALAVLDPFTSLRPLATAAEHSNQETCQIPSQCMYKRPRGDMRSHSPLGMMHRNRAYLKKDGWRETGDTAAVDMHIPTDDMQYGDSPQDAMWLGENPFQCEAEEHESRPSPAGSQATAAPGTMTVPAASTAKSAEIKSRAAEANATAAEIDAISTDISARAAVIDATAAETAAAAAFASATAVDCAATDATCDALVVQLQAQAKQAESVPEQAPWCHADTTSTASKSVPNVHMIQMNPELEQLDEEEWQGGWDLQEASLAPPDASYGLQPCAQASGLAATGPAVSLPPVSSAPSFITDSQPIDLAPSVFTVCSTPNCSPGSSHGHPSLSYDPSSPKYNKETAYPTVDADLCRSPSPDLASDDKPRQNPRHRLSSPGYSPRHGLSSPGNSPRHRLSSPQHSPRHRLDSPGYNPGHGLSSPGNSPTYRLSSPQHSPRHTLDSPRHGLRSPVNSPSHRLNSPGNSLKHSLSSPKHSHKHRLSRPGNSPRHRLSSPGSTPCWCQSYGHESSLDCSPNRSQSPARTPSYHRSPGHCRSYCHMSSQSLSCRATATSEGSPNPTTSPALTRSPNTTLGDSLDPIWRPSLSSSPGNSPDDRPGPIWTPSLSSSPGDSPDDSPGPVWTPSLSSSPGNSPDDSPGPIWTPSLSSSPGDSLDDSPGPIWTPSLSSSPDGSPGPICSPSHSPQQGTDSPGCSVDDGDADSDWGPSRPLLPGPLKQPSYIEQDHIEDTHASQHTCPSKDNSAVQTDTAPHHGEDKEDKDSSKAHDRVEDEVQLETHDKDQDDVQFVAERGGVELVAERPATRALDTSGLPQIALANLARLEEEECLIAHAAVQANILESCRAAKRLADELTPKAVDHTDLSPGDHQPEGSKSHDCEDPQSDNGVDIGTEANHHRPFKRLRKLNQDHTCHLRTAFHWRRLQGGASTADCEQSQTDATSRAALALSRADGDKPPQDGPTAGAQQLWWDHESPKG